ncbi:MAG TPA: FlgD immunoglobulin-like domain containing protein [Spirochaetota bacterium]|nr:FlgD immunoglobulin-like domain containing protein [Spirochaetota bacterium]
MIKKIIVIPAVILYCFISARTVVLESFTVKKALTVFSDLDETGAANTGNTTIKQSYDQEENQTAGGGYASKISYDIDPVGYAGVSVPYDSGLDISPYDTLSFKIRGNNEVSNIRFQVVRLEQVNGIWVRGSTNIAITSSWQTITIDLDSFISAASNSGRNIGFTWGSIEWLGTAGTAGTVWVDDLKVSTTSNDLSEDPGESALITNFQLSDTGLYGRGSETTITYYLAEKAEVDIAVFDLNGALVKNINQADFLQPAGLYSFKWKGFNQKGDFTPNGLYLIRMKVIKENGDEDYLIRYISSFAR